MNTRRIAKHTTDRPDKTGSQPLDMIPSLYREPGLGKWSFSPNGYTRFLEIAIRHFKDAASRCADNGLTDEYQLFTSRAQELQEKLDSVSGTMDNKNKVDSSD